jgi:hypothetical protein
MSGARLGTRNALGTYQNLAWSAAHHMALTDFPVPIQPTKPEPVATKPLNENDDGMRGPAADRLLRTNLAFHCQLAPVLTKGSSLESI